LIRRYLKDRHAGAKRLSETVGAGKSLAVIFRKLFQDALALTRARGLRRRRTFRPRPSCRFLSEVLCCVLIFFLFLGLSSFFSSDLQEWLTSPLTNLATFFGIFSKKSVATCTLDGRSSRAHAESDYHRNNNQISELGVLLDVKNIAALV